MAVDETLYAIEESETIEALKALLHKVVQSHGFASFAFVEMAHQANLQPLWMSTSNPKWISDYANNRFFEADPVIPVARRNNRVFSWSEVPLPTRRGKRKPVAYWIMEAARDHGLTEGLCIPFHYVDPIGRTRSASCVLYWTERPLDFARVPLQAKSELHIIMIYWMQRVIEVVDKADRLRAPASFLESQEEFSLTDRERQVLEWAARGKTVAESAAILGISSETVETHIRNAMRRLDAVNKTQAAVKAWRLGLIYV